MNTPLAILMRPKKISEIVGQQHLVGYNKAISNLVNNKKLFSMILYGEPGIGKTSIANAIINEFDFEHRFLNATINNKKDFDNIIIEARMYGNLVLVMDEIHRLNKDKQDLLLPHVESGLLTLIGLTTTNPYHSINKAILSRCHVFKLQPHTSDDIEDAIKNLINKNILENLTLSMDVIKYIIKVSAGDLRYVYNIIEFAYYSTNNDITIDYLTEMIPHMKFIHDKDADVYHHLISGFQKSIRGSDVDAALYYLARLLIVDDLEIIFRRLAIIVYEDIGLANSSLGPKVHSAIELCRMVGMPEGRLILANIVIEAALSPKSNSAHLAIDKAILDASNETVILPEHIKTNSPHYKYPHDYRNYYVKQQYLPDEIINHKYYEPKNNKYEQALYEFNKKIKEDK